MSMSQLWLKNDLLCHRSGWQLNSHIQRQIEYKISVFVKIGIYKVKNNENRVEVIGLGGGNIVKITEGKIQNRH